jgi:AcrR family transcriptional regulator
MPQALASIAPARRPRGRTRPGPGRPRKGAQEQRNRDLLMAALDLFLERGFDGATLAGIMAEAGMAKRTLLQLYPTKSRLFRAALELAVAEWVIPHDELRAAETADFEETMLRVADLLIRNATSPDGLRLMRITNAEAYRHPEVGTYALRTGTMHSVEYLADLFRRRLDRGDGFPDAEAYAGSFISMLLTPARVLAWGEAYDEEDIRKHVRHCVQLLLHGLPGRVRVAQGDEPAG